MIISIKYFINKSLKLVPTILIITYLIVLINILPFSMQENIAIFFTNSYSYIKVLFK